MKTKMLAVAILATVLLSGTLYSQIKILPSGTVKIGAAVSTPDTDGGVDVITDRITFKVGSRNLIPSFSEKVGLLKIYTLAKTIRAVGVGGGGVSIGGGGDPSVGSGEMFNTILEGTALQFGSRQNEVSSIYSKSYYSSVASGISRLSDRRYKENIRGLENVLGIMENLRPVRFDYLCTDPQENPTDSLNRKNKIGFIAQEIETVIPESVHYDEHNDIYSVEEAVLIPFLVKSIQELNSKIEELEDQLQYLQIENSNPIETEENGVKLAFEINTHSGVKNKLWSNSPNPFSEQTKIRYELTKGAGNSFIYIYNLQGEQKKSYPLDGSGELIIQAGEFTPGMYLYSLIVGDNVIDTKRMVVTK